MSLKLGRCADGRITPSTWRSRGPRASSGVCRAATSKRRVLRRGSWAAELWCCAGRWGHPRQQAVHVPSALFFLIGVTSFVSSSVCRGSPRRVGLLTSHLCSLCKGVRWECVGVRAPCSRHVANVLCAAYSGCAAGVRCTRWLLPSVCGRGCLLSLLVRLLVRLLLRARAA